MIEAFSPEYEHSLICKAKTGDNRAAELLLTQYAPLISQFVARSNIPGFDKDDLRQEFRLALLDAIVRFDSGKETRFITYLHLMLGYWYSNIIKQQKRDKRKMIFESMASLDEVTEDMSIMNLIEDPRAKTSFDEIIVKHSLPDFNDTELEIFNMEQQGCDNAEIASSLDITVVRVAKIKQIVAAKIAHHRKLYHRT